MPLPYHGNTMAAIFLFFGRMRRPFFVFSFAGASTCFLSRWRKNRSAFWHLLVSSCDDGGNFSAGDSRKDVLGGWTFLKQLPTTRRASFLVARSRHRRGSVKLETFGFHDHVKWGKQSLSSSFFFVVQAPVFVLWHFEKTKCWSEHFSVTCDQMFTGVSVFLFFFLQLKTVADFGHGRRNGSEEPTSCGFCAPSFPFFLKKGVLIGMASKDSLIIERPEFNGWNHFRTAKKDVSDGVLLQTPVVPCWSRPPFQ